MTKIQNKEFEKLEKEIKKECDPILIIKQGKGKVVFRLDKYEVYNNLGKAVNEGKKGKDLPKVMKWIIKAEGQLISANKEFYCPVKVKE